MKAYLPTLALQRAPYLQSLLATLLTLALWELEPGPGLQQGGNLILASWFGFLAARLGGSRFETWSVVTVGWLPPLIVLTLSWESLPVWLQAMLSVSWALQPVLVSWILGRRLLFERSVSLEELWGAIAVYILIGLAFANLYEVVLVFDPDALLFQNPSGAGSATFSDMLYFSFITLGTVGYGDVAPVSRGLRLVAMFEALVGLMYIAVILGRVVAMHTAGHLSVETTAAGDTRNAGPDRPDGGDT